MIEVLINGTNVKTEYGLILQSKEIGTPEPKRVLVEIPGRDGTLDLTQGVFGKAAYLGNRAVKLSFVTDGNDAEVFSNAMALWHGKNIEIEFSDDIGWKFKGFCEVSLASVGGHYQTITLEVNAEPYMEKYPRTLKEAQGGVLTLENLYGKSNLVINAKSEATLTYNDDNVLNLVPYPYYDGTHKEQNGLVFDVKTDGSIVVNGTATAITYFYIRRRQDLNFYLPQGNYYFSGCPSGGGSGKYRLKLDETNESGSATTITSDFGNGRAITIDESQSLRAKQIVIQIDSGQTINNLVFKPMLEIGSKANTYVPTNTKKTIAIAEGINNINLNAVGNRQVLFEPKNLIAIDSTFEYTEGAL